MSDGEKFVASVGGATSSRVPRLDLIPYAAYIRLATRFEYGLERHGKDNWRKGIGDKAYAIERATHVVHHALKLINKLEGLLPDDGDDDVGAILWGGAFLAEATDFLKKQKNCSACGGSGRCVIDEAIVDTCPACKGTGKSKL